MADKHAASRIAGRFQSRNSGKPQKRERFDKKKIFPKQKKKGELVDEEINSLKEKYGTVSKITKNIHIPIDCHFGICQ